MGLGSKKQRMGLEWLRLVQQSGWDQQFFLLDVKD
jgi:hypothetical protein